MKKFDLIVYIGRFQPPTKAHVATIVMALGLADHVLVIAGSAYQARTVKNPFTFAERKDMLQQIFGPNHAKLSYAAGRDNLYNNAAWAAEIQKTVSGEAYDLFGPRDVKIGIIGHRKDNSSFYLDMFPQWEFIQNQYIEGVNATDIRDVYFGGLRYDLLAEYGSVGFFLTQFKKTPEYARLAEEHRYLTYYKESWKAAPYPPTFVTADAVVEQSGHILLVQRGAAPGEGLWALPGGFVNQFESIEDAAIRELREETKLKVPAPVLRGSIEWKDVFDNPYRSLRGRTITHAFMFRLPPGELPKVKGSDDAKHAKWFPISDVLRMEEQMFEDHMSIIKRMTGV